MVHTRGSSKGSTVARAKGRRSTNSRATATSTPSLISPDGASGHSSRPRGDEASYQAGSEIQKGKKTRLKKDRKGNSAVPSAKSSAVAKRENELRIKEDLQKELDASIEDLKNRTSTFLKTDAIQRSPSMPDVELVRMIASLTKRATIPVIMSKLNNIPRVLLIGARKGIDNGDSHHESGSAALSDALMQFARGSTVPPPNDAPDRKLRRSAFRKDDKSQLSNADKELLNRAGKWATNLLTGCIRGDGRTEPRNDLSTAVSCSRRPTEHGDVSLLFVAPRDTVDSAMSGLYAAHVAKCVRNLTNWGLLALDIHEFCRSALDRLCRDISSPCLVPVIEATIAAATEVEMPVNARDSGMNDPLPAIFIDRIVASRTNRLFQRMSRYTRHSVLRISAAAWDVEVRIAREAFLSDRWLSRRDEVQLVQSISSVAAIDVERHWEFMDEARREVSSSSEPFSTNLWTNRRFCRAVLSLIVDDVLRMCNDSTQLSSVSPLFRRFPRTFRPMIKSISALRSCTDSAGTTTNEKAAIMGVDIVYHYLGLGDSLIISPNVHACLLCIEGLLEGLFWGCGCALSSWGAERRPELRKEAQEIVKKLAALIAVMETMRLPGGTPAETEEVIRSRADEVGGTLQRMLETETVEQHLSGQRMKLNGLMAMVIAGLISWSPVKGMRKFAISLDDGEACEMLRAVEISHERASDNLTRSRTLDAHREVVGVLQKRFHKSKNEKLFASVSRRRC